MGGDYSIVLAEPWRIQVKLWRGDVAGAAASVSRTISRAREIGDPQVFVPAVATAGLVAVWDGRIDEAAALVEDLGRTSDVSFAWYREQFIPDLVRICSMSGRLDLASGLLDRSQAFTVRHRLSLLTARATLDEALEHRETALRAYREAFLGWTEFGHVLEAGMAQFGAGRCLGPESGSESLELVRRARETFVGLGAELLVAETTRYLEG